MTHDVPHDPVEPAVLDEAALAVLRGIDQTGSLTLVAKMARAFESTLAKQVPQLHLKLAEDDRKGVRDAAHTLKSASAYLGALELSKLSAMTERQAFVADAAVLRRLVDEVVREVEPALLAVRLLPEVVAS